MSGYIIQRYWLNFKRHRIFFFLSVMILVAIAALFCAIYPGPEAVEAFVSIPVFQILTGISDIQNPGMLIWLLIFYGSFALTIFFPVVGIFFGVNILPFSEKEGKELLFSTEKSLLRYYLENLIIVLILIPITMLPSYLIGVGFLLSSGGSGDLSAFTIASVLPIFFVFVVTMITSLGCSIKSSQKTGYALGGIFFIVSFTLNLLQSEIDFAKDINLMSNIGSFEHAIAGTWNEGFILTCLFLIVLLAILTIFFLYRTDFIQSRSSYKENVEVKDKRGIVAKFSFIRTPVESILSRVGWKFPAFRDQLQSTAGIFLIYICVISILQALIAQAYPGDKLMATIFSEMTAILDSPIFAAFTFGHTMVPTFGGYVILKFFILHWIFYGPFLLIMTYNIIMRDKNAGYDEITWSMPRTRSRVILERTIAAIVYLWIIILANFVALYLSEILLTTYSDIVLTDFGSTALTFIYLGIGYSIFLVLFVALASIPRSKYLLMTVVGTFLVALFVPIIWYINQDLSFLIYFSPFYYFDVAGVLLNDILLEQAIPETFIYGVVTIVFFVSILKFWTPRKDIT